MAKYETAKRVLLFVILGLLLAILILILVNAIRRTCADSSSANAHDDEWKVEKCVDFLANDMHHLEQIPGRLPGMTALIDHGITNLETGIYMLQQEDLQWVKIGVPEEAERYRILRGENRNKRYTIRRAFVNEVKPPSELQTIGPNQMTQDLALDTSVVCILSTVTMPKIVFLFAQLEKLASL